MSAIRGYFFRVSIVVIASAVIVLARLTVTDRRKKEESQKIDDLPVLATHQSGTSAMHSSKVNGPVTHGRTLIWLIEDFDLSNVAISSVSFVHF